MSDLSTSQDYQNFMANLTKLFRLQAESIIPPTFTQETANQISEVLSELKTLTAHGNSVLSSDNFQEISQSVQRLIDLAQHNFFQRTIADLQANFQHLNRTVIEISEILKKVPGGWSLDSVLSYVQTLAPKILIITYDKVLTASYNFIQQAIHTIQSETSFLQEIGVVRTNQTYIEMQKLLRTIDSDMKHIIGAHSFLDITLSLQGPLRVFAASGLIVQKQQANALHKIRPSKPVIKDAGDLTAAQILNDYVRQNKKDQEANQEFVDKFQQAISKELKLENSTFAIQKLLDAILRIVPPQDPKKKIFIRFQNYIIRISQCMTYLYKIPRNTSSLSDVVPFVESVDALKVACNELVHAKKKPSWWTENDSDFFSKSVEPITAIANVLNSSMGLVQKANEHLGNIIITVDLSHILPKPISLRFVIEETVSSPKMKRFNAIRALNAVAPKLSELEEKGVHMKHSKDEPVDVIHPAVFTDLFNKIRGEVGSIEIDIFNMSLEKFNDFPVSRSGVTVLSTLARLPLNLEEFILSMHTIPLEVSGIREVSMLLFDQNLSASSEQYFKAIIGNLYAVFEVYQVYEQLQYAGAADISFCAQISFLATMAAKMALTFDEIKPIAEYLASINLLDVNTDDLMIVIRDFRDKATDIFMDWKYESIVLKFQQKFKSTYVALANVRKFMQGSVEKRLLLQLTNWIANLTRNFPKQNNLREMQIRMVVLKNYILKHIEESKDGANTADYNSILDTINGITELRENLLMKTLFKVLLSFVDKIGFGEAPQQEKAPVRTTSSLQLEEEPVELDDSKVKLIDFNDKEKELWKGFAANTLKPQKVSINQQQPSYTDELIHSREREVFDELKNELPNKTFFEPELSIIDEQISNKEFTEDAPEYKELQKKIKTTLVSYIENACSVLYEISPVTRGRFHSRDQKGHRYSAQISEVVKSLGSIKARLNGSDFKWIKGLIGCYCSISALLKGSEVAGDFRSPKIIMRKIINISFAAYKLDRCVSMSKEGGKVSFELDTEMIKGLISIILEAKPIIRDDKPLLFHEITQIVNNQAISNFADLITTFKTFCTSRAVFDIKELVSRVDDPFFNWSEYFKKLPHDYLSLSSLLRSDTYEKFASSILPASKFVESKFSDSFVQERLSTLLSFKVDVSQSPFQVNWENMEDCITYLMMLQNFVDLSFNIDRTYPLFQHKKEQRISGTSVLAVEILICELQNLTESLVISNPTSICQLYISSSKVHAVFNASKSKFGPRNIETTTLKDLASEWNNFLRDISEIPLDEFLEIFRKNAFIIMNIIKECPPEDTRDLKSIEFLINSFETLPSKELALKLIVAFQFISKQPNRFISSGNALESTQASHKMETADLPFYQVMRSLKSIITLYNIYEVIPLITKTLNSILGDIIDDSIPSLGKENVQIPEEEIQISKQHFDKPLSMFDQTALAQMSAALFDANLADSEKIAMKDILLKKVERQREILEEQKEEINGIEEINKEMMKIVETQIPQPSSLTNSETDEELRKRREMRASKAEKLLNDAKDRYKIESENIISLEKDHVDLEASLNSLDTKLQGLSHVNKANDIFNRTHEMQKLEDNWDNAISGIFSLSIK